MKNGTVILTYPRGKFDKWYVNFVIWCIQKVTKSKYIHTQVWVDGYMLETVHPSGFQKKKQTPEKREGLDFLEPIRDLTQKECDSITAYFDDKIRNNIPYGYAKLFLSFILAWSRPFWEKIKWIPFQEDKIWGNHCSSGVDEAFKFSGIDILPNGYEEITSPSDFIQSDFFIIK
jgi:hypothetical protein